MVASAKVGGGLAHDHHVGVGKAVAAYLLFPVFQVAPDVSGSAAPLLGALQRGLVRQAKVDYLINALAPSLSAGRW